MKKFLLFPLLVFMTALVVPACSDDEEDIFPPGTSDTIGGGSGGGSNSGDSIINGGDSIINGGDTLNNDININRSRIFNGTLVVNESYVQDSINCEIVFDTKSLALNIYNVKFAAAMPVSISLTVPGIPYERTGVRADRVFAGDSIVPLMGIMPVPQYMFEEIDGSIQGRALNFSATITGRGTFTFSGKERKEIGDLE